MKPRPYIRWILAAPTRQSHSNGVLVTPPSRDVCTPEGVFADDVVRPSFVRTTYMGADYLINPNFLCPLGTEYAYPPPESAAFSDAPEIYDTVEIRTTLPVVPKRP